MSVDLCYTQSKAKHRVCYAGIDKTKVGQNLIKSPSTFRLKDGWMDRWMG
jgi:hypothetical protein